MSLPVVRQQIADSFGADFASVCTERLLEVIAGIPGTAPRPKDKIVEFGGVAAPAPGPRADRIQALKAVQAVRFRDLVRNWGLTPEDAAAHGFESCWLNGTVRIPALFVPMALLSLPSEFPPVQVDAVRLVLREINKTVPSVRRPPTLGMEPKELTGRGVVVAVIDGQIDAAHHALSPRVIRRKDFTGQEWASSNAEDARHATAIAGIIGANHPGGNGKPAYMGVAPEVVIWNYKIEEQTDDFTAMLAIQMAVDDGVPVVNFSWGLEPPPRRDGGSREARGVDMAWNLGTLLVKSAGNGHHDGTITSPGDAAGTIVVGATVHDASGIADYSSRGPTQKTGDPVRPHLVAPGGDTFGAMTSCRAASDDFGSVGAGTSFAAPHVTGALALLLEESPGLTPFELRAKLLESCRKMKAGDGTPIDVNAQGAGLLQVPS